MIRVIRNYGGRDPMNSLVPGAVWVGRDDRLPTLASQPVPEPEPAMQMTPDMPDVQYNLHVMDYWNWRIGRLVDGITGVRRLP